jgi:hypothetical protein
MKTISFLALLLLLACQVKVTFAISKTVVNLEEMRLSNTTENSFADFTDLKFKKINRTQYAVTGAVKLLRDVFEETNLQVLIFILWI